MSGVKYALERLTTTESREFKPSHLKTLVASTYSKVSIAELNQYLIVRMQQNKWTVTLKCLSLILYLTRNANTDRILGYIFGNPELVEPRIEYDQKFSQDACYIEKLTVYLRAKAETFATVKLDWITKKDEWRYRFQTMDDGSKCFEYFEFLQSQIDIAISCCGKVGPNNDIVAIQAYGLLVLDLSDLTWLQNQSIVRVLSKIH